MNRLISFKNFYRFEARLYHVPVSQNIFGVDPLPKFFIKATKLKECLEVSEDAQSIDDGYVKDKDSSFYVRNHSKLLDGTITEADVEAQFAEIAMNPPFWYGDESSYALWAQTNMNPIRAARMQAMFSLLPTVTSVPAGTDPLVPVDHHYVDIEEWVIKTFSRVEPIVWPKQPKVKFKKV